MQWMLTLACPMTTDEVPRLMIMAADSWRYLGRHKCKQQYVHKACIQIVSYGMTYESRALPPTVWAVTITGWSGLPLLLSYRIKYAE